MARPRPPGQLGRLLDAAHQVFARRGLRRARMTDIARAAGVAPATLYHYFESKEALFYYVLERSTRAAELELPETLPVPDPGSERLSKLLESRAGGGRLPALDRALEGVRASDVRAELAAIVAELYDRIERGRRVADLVEACAADRPELSKIWLGRARRGTVGRLARYLEQRRQEGGLRAEPDATVAARFILETCVWFARRRHADPRPQDLPDAAAVRATVIDLIVQGLIEPDGGGP